VAESLRRRLFRIVSKVNPTSAQNLNERQFYIFLPQRTQSSQRF
jgi:hypothetical protein